MTSDATERDIRRAYAAKLKQLDTTENPEAFQELRSAYEAALMVVRVLAARAVSEVEAPEDWIDGEVEDQTEDEVFELVFPQSRTAPPDVMAPFRIMRALVEKRDYSVSTWQRLLNDPLLDDVERGAAFEYALVEALTQNELKTEYTLSAGKQWRDLIETRYAWISDGLRYGRRFPYYADLRQALVELGRPSRPIPYSPVPQRDNSGKRTLFIGIVIFVLLAMLKLFAQ